MRSAVLASSPVTAPRRLPRRIRHALAQVAARTGAAAHARAIGHRPRVDGSHRGSVRRLLRVLVRRLHQDRADPRGSRELGCQRDRGPEARRGLPARRSSRPPPSAAPVKDALDRSARHVLRGVHGRARDRQGRHRADPAAARSDREGHRRRDRGTGDHRARRRWHLAVLRAVVRPGLRRRDADDRGAVPEPALACRIASTTSRAAARSRSRAACTRRTRSACSSCSASRRRTRRRTPPTRIASRPRSRRRSRTRSSAASRTTRTTASNAPASRRSPRAFPWGDFPRRAFRHPEGHRDHRPRSGELHRRRDAADDREAGRAPRVLDVVRARRVGAADLGHAWVDEDFVMAKDAARARAAAAALAPLRAARGSRSRRATRPVVRATASASRALEGARGRPDGKEVLGAMRGELDTLAVDGRQHARRGEGEARQDGLRSSAVRQVAQVRASSRQAHRLRREPPRRDAGRARAPVQRRSASRSIDADWQMTPPTVNAYYDRVACNEIVLPAGELQAPFFGEEVPSRRQLRLDRRRHDQPRVTYYGFDDNEAASSTPSGNLERSGGRRRRPRSSPRSPRSASGSVQQVRGGAEGAPRRRARTAGAEHRRQRRRQARASSRTRLGASGMRRRCSANIDVLQRRPAVLPRRTANRGATWRRRQSLETQAHTNEALAGEVARRRRDRESAGLWRGVWRARRHADEPGAREELRGLVATRQRYLSSVSGPKPPATEAVGPLPCAFASASAAWSAESVVTVTTR